MGFKENMFKRFYVLNFRTRTTKSSYFFDGYMEFNKMNLVGILLSLRICLSVEATLPDTNSTDTVSWRGGRLGDFIFVGINLA